MTPRERRDPRTRQAALRRLLRVLALLSESPRTLQELAEELQATTRTIRRDLALLEEVYVPIGRYGPYYRLSGGLPWGRVGTVPKTDATV